MHPFFCSCSCKKIKYFAFIHGCYLLVHVIFDPVSLRMNVVYSYSCNFHKKRQTEPHGSTVFLFSLLFLYYFLFCWFCRTKTMHQCFSSCSCKFPNYFAFTLGCMLLTCWYPHHLLPYIPWGRVRVVLAYHRSIHFITPLCLLTIDGSFATFRY